MTKLKSLSLKNFRGFSEHKIELGQETILIGKNNAGKTTVIEALRILSVCQARIPTAIYSAAPQWLDGICAGAGFHFSLETIDFDFSNIQHAYNSTAPAIIKAKNKNHSEVNIYIGTSPAEVFCQLRLSQRSIVHTRSMASKSFGKVKVMPPIGTLLSHEKPIAKDRLRKFLDGYLAFRHFRNQLWERPAEYRRFKGLLEETWSGLAIQHFENDHGEKRNEFSLLVREGPFTSEVSWHGHGLQAWLQTVWFLARTGRESTIVLDEPDVYLHADLQRKLIKLIESLDFSQAIIATHSSEIIGDVPFHHVTVVQKRERVSRPAEMAHEIQSALSGMGSLHSIQLAKVAQTGLVFFVEGDDKPFLTDVAFKMGPSKFDAISSMAIQEIKGKDNWKFALGASKALNLASGGQIGVVLLLDRDFMLDQEVEKYFQTAKNEGLILKIWERKEIENYFICAQSIARYCTVRSEEDVRVEEIDELIADAEWRMRDELIGQFSDRFQQVVKPRIAPSAAFKNARQMIERRLESGARLRDLIGGKALISSLSKECQDRYNVSFNALAICKSMLLSDVPDELKSLVGALTKPRSLNPNSFG